MGAKHYTTVITLGILSGTSKYFAHNFISVVIYSNLFGTIAGGLLSVRTKGQKNFLVNIFYDYIVVSCLVVYSSIKYFSTHVVNL